MNKREQAKALIEAALSIIAIAHHKQFETDKAGLARAKLFVRGLLKDNEKVYAVSTGTALNILWDKNKQIAFEAANLLDKVPTLVLTDKDLDKAIKS
jgi:hypothetical protein